jgi:hypothetical protein
MNEWMTDGWMDVVGSSNERDMKKKEERNKKRNENYKVMEPSHS